MPLPGCAGGVSLLDLEGREREGKPLLRGDRPSWREIDRLIKALAAFPVSDLRTSISLEIF